MAVCPTEKLNKLCSTSTTRIASKLKEFGLFKYRGKRGGKKIVRNIMTFSRSRRRVRSVAAGTRDVTTVNIERKCNVRNDLPNIFLTNPQSLTNCFDEFTHYINKFRPHIIGVSETWFSVNKPAQLFQLDEYVLYHKDRTNRRGGGVATYVHESLEVHNLNIVVPDDLECVWVGVKRKVSHQDDCVLHFVSSATLCGGSSNSRSYPSISTYSKSLFGYMDV